MYAANTAGLLSDEQTKELKRLRKVVASTKLKLKRLKSCQRASKKMRKRTRDVVKRAKASNPDEFSTYELQNEFGRPQLERQHPDLLDTIIRITTAHCAADERRRTENLRCMRTLDDLLFELQIMGFNISRSGLYLRLLPRNCITTEGKRHTRTVPVKLIRSQNTLRKPHDDSHFAAATIMYLKDAATIFGSESVFLYLSTRLCLSFAIPPLPFGHFCPSVTLKLPERTCQICFIGFSSKKAFIGHKVIHRNEEVDKEGDDATSYDDDEQDPEASEVNFADNTNEIYQIQNMSSWLKSPFIEDESF